MHKHKIMHKHKNVTRLGQIAATAMMVATPTLIPHITLAQELQENRALEEIFVTARKRGAESLQGVPATITAMTGQKLETMGAVNFADFAYHVPGLTFSDEGSGEKRYVVRGVRSAGQAQVAVYYDETPVPGIQSSSGDTGSQTTDLKLFDIERVEVLKGPQGTTYGANSQSGTVRFLLKKPVMDEVQGKIKAEANSIEGGSLGANIYGMINMPLVQNKLSFRGVAYFDREGGYVDNVRLGNDNINWVETTGFRGSLRLEPTDSVTLDFMTWFESRTVNASSRYNPFDSFSGGPDGLDFVDNALEPLTEIREIGYFETGDLQVGDYTSVPKQDNQELHSLTLNWDLDWANLVATGSYYKRDFGFNRDSSWVLLRLGVRPEGYPGITPVRPDLFPALTDQTQDVEQKSFEARLNSTSGSALQWMGGVFYRHRDSYFRSFVPVVNEDGVPFDPGTSPTGYDVGAPGEGIPECNPCVTARENDRKIEEIAFFGELSYELTNELEVMAGLRWFEATQSDVGETIFPFALFGGALPPADIREFKENKIIKKFQLSYRATDDAVLYALASQGFRLGGTNQQGVVAVPPGYEADGLWNYELGAKTSWFNNQLILNLAVFQIDWKNIQVAGRDPTGAFGFIGNAGAAKVQGLEAEVQASPVDGLDLTGGFSWLNKRELTKDQITDEVIAPGRAGDKLPFIPAVTASATAQWTYNLPVADWLGFIRAEYSYRGRSNSEFDTTSRLNRVQHGYSIINARTGFYNDATGIDIQFYVENVLDTRGDVRVRTEDSLMTFKWTNTPRTIGISATKTF